MDEQQEFEARFEAMKKMSGDLLTATAMSCARMCDFGDDAECVYLRDRLSDINQRMADIHTELHDLWIGLLKES